jgi:copper chaperone
MASLHEETLTVTGMTCQGCERNVGRALEPLDGVVRVRADHASDRVVVRYDRDRVSRDTHHGAGPRHRVRRRLILP